MTDNEQAEQACVAGFAVGAMIGVIGGGAFFGPLGALVGMVVCGAFGAGTAQPPNKVKKGE